MTATHSRKKYRAPPTQPSIDDGPSTTTESSSSNLPAQSRRQSSVTSIPTIDTPSHSNMIIHDGPPQPANSNGGMQDNINGTASISVTSVEQTASAGKQPATTNYASDKPFPCTFPGCLKIFKTKKDLIRHKIADDEGHDYCKTCDMDFKDDESHHLHKLGSDKHVCCPICSEDFKSEGGRDRHFTQMHSAEQNINCRGCGKHFLKGAALMNHIEKNQCPKIGPHDFETQRAMVANTMQKFTTENPDDLGLLALRISTNGESSIGGVPIARSILDNEETPDDLNMNIPSLTRVLSNSSSATSTASVIQIKGYNNNYPALGSDPKTKGKERVKSRSNAASIEAEPIAETWAKQHFPDAPQTPAPAGWKPGPSSNPGFVNTVDAATGKTGHFRLADLKQDPVDGFFHCPFPGCADGLFRTHAMIAVHLQSGIHKGVDNRCVGCLRMFKSPSALTAHMESASARCQVRDSRQFGNALSLISGGYLGINGRHVDGSIKIDTPETPPYAPHW